MKIIRNGNLVPWVRTTIWIVGLAIAFFSYFFMMGHLMYWGMIAGIVISSVGAYAEQANTLKLKPFDDTYKKARKSYEKENDES